MLTKRVIDISTEGFYLRFKHKQLLLEHQGKIKGKVPIEDMAALIIDHPQTLITHKCLSELVKANVMVVSSDEKHLPIGLLLPLDSNTLQGERFAAQANLAKPVKKRLWKQLITQKIRLQGKVLKEITGKDAGLSPLSKKVRSGDPDNLEAQAARRYWRRLFPENTFKRQREGDDQNRYLNYSYAILRALVTRSICASGLHPCLGIHHHNRYNVFALADDIMECYRPYVDVNVRHVVENFGSQHEMSPILRSELLSFIKQDVMIDAEKQTMQGAIQTTCQSFTKVVLGETKVLALPNI